MVNQDEEVRHINHTGIATEPQETNKLLTDQNNFLTTCSRFQDIEDQMTKLTENVNKTITDLKKKQLCNKSRITELRAR